MFSVNTDKMKIHLIHLFYIAINAADSETFSITTELYPLFEGTSRELFSISIFILVFITCQLGSFQTFKKCPVQAGLVPHVRRLVTGPTAPSSTYLFRSP